jgi:hypothetical protein
VQNNRVDEVFLSIVPCSASIVTAMTGLDAHEVEKWIQMISELLIGIWQLDFKTVDD